MIGVPDYVEPTEYNSPDSEWEPDEEGMIQIRDDLSVSLEWEGRRVIIRCNTENDEQLWAIVHYCKEYGIPGCWKSFIDDGGDTYRIGGLYCIAGFELTERETNYEKYGETPYVEA